MQSAATFSTRRAPGAIPRLVASALWRQAVGTRTLISGGNCRSEVAPGGGSGRAQGDTFRPQPGPWIIPRTWSTSPHEYTLAHETAGRFDEGQVGLAARSQSSVRRCCCGLVHEIGADQRDLNAPAEQVSTVFKGSTGRCGSSGVWHGTARGPQRRLIETGAGAAGFRQLPAEHSASGSELSDVDALAGGADVQRRLDQGCPASTICPSPPRRRRCAPSLTSNFAVVDKPTLM